MLTWAVWPPIRWARAASVRCAGRSRQRHVHDALLLPDEAIRAAQLWLWKELKLAVEPAAALGLAALQTGAYKPQPQETVALILCGANLTRPASA